MYRFRSTTLFYRMLHTNVNKTHVPRFFLNPEKHSARIPVCEGTEPTTFHFKLSFNRILSLQMIDSGITCMVKINSNFWKWTFLFTNDNFQTGSLSEELWQKSIFVFLGQGVITSSSELSTSSNPQPSYSIPPAHPYNIGHTSCSPSIAFGNRNATISSITTSHSENVRKFW